MQDPNADTEWNDVLRKKGVIPPKMGAGGELEITEESITQMLDERIQGEQDRAMGIRNWEDMTLDQIEELEDDEDERMLEHYRQKRILELQEKQKAAKFGDVREISAEDYKREVNNAGENIWVILHLYKTGIPLCALINQQIVQLSRKYPQMKFLKSISTVCIPNFPDQNLPALFIYHEGQIKKQLVGELSFGGMNMTVDELDFRLNRAGVPTDVTKNPRPEVKDVMMSSVRQAAYNAHYDSEDEDDW